MFGNEHESSPPLSPYHYFKIVVYDGYVKYEEAEIHRSAFRDSEKIILKKFAKLKEDVMATFSWNALTSISSLVAIVIKGLMIWGSKCHQNNSPMVCDGYVKYEEAEVDRLVAILKTNNCSGGGGPYGVW